MPYLILGVVIILIVYYINKMITSIIEKIKSTIKCVGVILLIVVGIKYYQISIFIGIMWGAYKIIQYLLRIITKIFKSEQEENGK